MRIEDQLAQVNFKDHNQVINFYESNRIYFDNYQLLENTDKISEFIHIKLHYANALTEKYHLDKLFPILEQVSELLQRLPKDHSNYEESKRHMQFLKGMALGHKNQFKESFKIFKSLTQEDPDHHLYKVWYQHTRIGIYNWLFNLAAVFGLVLILIDMLFYFVINAPLPIDLAIVGMVILGLTWIIKIGFKQYIKRKKTATNTG